MSRARRGRPKSKVSVPGNENILEIHDPDQGLLLYRPSSSLMPARPLGAPDEVQQIPIVVIKDEIEAEEAETESTLFSILDATTESTIHETLRMIDATNDHTPIVNAYDDKVSKIKFETEPFKDVSGDIQPALDRKVESPRINEEISTELNHNSIKCNEGAAVHNLENTFCNQNPLALWDLEQMFADASRENLEDESPEYLESFIYLDFCRDVCRTDIEECLEYLSSSFHIIKKSPVLSLRVPSQRKNNSTEVQSEKTVAFGHDVSTEDLKRTTEVPNLPVISSDESKSQSIQSNAPQLSESDDFCLKEIVKKEHLSPQKSEPHSHLVHASNIQPVSSKIVPEVSVASKEFLKTSVSCASEEILSVDISIETLKKILEVSNLPSISTNLPGENNSLLFQSYAQHQTSKCDLKANVKKEPVSPQRSEVEPDKEIVSRKSDSVSKFRSISQSVRCKVVPEFSITLKESTVNSASEEASFAHQQISRSASTGIKETAIKQEPVSPKKSEPYSNVVDAGKESLSVNSDSIVSKLPSDIQPDSSEIVLGVSKKSDDFDGTTVTIKKEPISPKSISSNFSEGKEKYKKRKIVCNIDLNSAKKRIKEEPDEEPDIIEIAVFPKVIKAEPFEEINKSLPASKYIPSLIRQSDSATAAIVKDRTSVICQSIRATSVKCVPVTGKCLAPNEVQMSTMVQSPYIPPQKSNFYEPPQKKRLTHEEYLRRQSYSNSSNSNISKSLPPQNSFLNPLDQMFQMDNSIEPLKRDPRLQNGALFIPSISGFPQEVEEPLNVHRISQSDATSQNIFEPRRGNDSDVMKQLREKIGRRFISPNDVVALILEWNVSWLEKQKEKSVVPPIIRDTFNYPKVNDGYKTLDNYYNTYLPLHLLNIWMSIYRSWEQEDFLLGSFFEDKVEKSTHVQIRCSVTLNAEKKTKLPKTEDILICHVEGDHPKKLFGRVVNVDVINNENSPFGNQGVLKARININCAEDLGASSKYPVIMLKKLKNMRIALYMCHALQHIDSSLRLAILDPAKSSHRVEIIRAQPFRSADSIQRNTDEIMRSARSRSITIVHTEKTLDSLTAITGIVPKVVGERGLIFICMKGEADFFKMADGMLKAKYNPVLAVKEEDVPNLPHRLAPYTIKNFKLGSRCHVVLTLMSALSIGELKTMFGEIKNTMCVVHEAHRFLETETAVLLEHNFKSLVLLGRDGLVGNVEDVLKQQSFHKSLFKRIFDSA